MRDRQAQLALTRQRLLTLAFEDMETVRMVGGVSLPILKLQLTPSM